jgi:hypothetical protein
MELLIYTEAISPRANFTFSLVFKNLLGINFFITQDFSYFIHATQPKINYSDKTSDAFPTIIPYGLLSETKIRKVEIDVVEVDGLKCFFKTANDTAYPFDIFSAIFYLTSRYEEYLPYKAGKHNRFPAEESIAYKNGFLEIPLVNIWAEDFKKYLLAYYPSIQFKQNVFQHLSTIDVDNGYAYKGKSFFKTFGGIARALLMGNLREFLERVSVVFGNLEDPYETYGLQKSLREKYKLNMLYFMLCGAPGNFDHNILPGSKYFKNIVHKVKAFARIGIHPSYASNTRPGQLEKEIKTLENLLGEPVVRSRQHYLIMKMPETYDRLIKLGVQEEYSMGYASHNGFRASICTPFHFYHLKEEKETRLIIYPFQVMEGVFMNYQNIGPEEALTQIKKIIQRVKAVNGLFVSVWHDRTFSNRPENKGWNKVFKEMAKEAAANHS